jgi:glycosyltransferase involved in cell wall biosynthesis
MHIHISFISTGFYAVISKIAGCKVTIVHTHTTNFSSSVFTKVLKSFVNVFLSVYKIKLIADSSESGRIFFNMKFKVMPITVNENKFRYSRSDREQVRLDLGLDKAFVMCSIGRLAEHKNHKFMLDILTELEKISPCNHLILVGDGEKKDFIIEYAVKKQVISNLSLFEPMYNIERIMAASDVFLFPSTYEGLGLVAIEAQINGLRVLASQFVPAETQITPLIDYLDISDTNAWVENILELKHRRSTSRENACINNNTKYSTEFLCNFLVDLYEEL